MADPTEAGTGMDMARLSDQERLAVAERLLSRLPQTAASDLRDAVVAGEGDVAPDPVPGDLWRVAWDTTALLTLVLEVSGPQVSVAPVTLDMAEEDDQTVLLPADSQILGVPATSWLTLVRELPLRVFDAYLGRIQPQHLSAARLLFDARAERDAGESATARRMSQVDSAGAERLAELDDDLAVLSEADWAPASDEVAVTIPDLLVDRADFEEFQQALGVTPGRAWQLWCGERSLAPGEADVVGRRFGISPDVLLKTAPLPTELVAELDRPVWRSELRTRKSALGMDDRQVRLDAAYGCLVPTRATGAGGGEWPQLLRQYFATHPLPEDAS